MPFIENIIVVDPFIIHNESCNQIILYLISLDLHINFLKYLNICENDTRFVQVESVQIFIHDGPYKAIKYKVVAGYGYKLPLIKNYFPCPR